MNAVLTDQVTKHLSLFENAYDVELSYSAVCNSLGIHDLGIAKKHHEFFLKAREILLETGSSISDKDKAHMAVVLFANNIGTFSPSLVLEFVTRLTAPMDYKLAISTLMKFQAVSEHSVSCKLLIFASIAAHLLRGSEADFNIAESIIFDVEPQVESTYGLDDMAMGMFQYAMYRHYKRISDYPKMFDHILNYLKWTESCEMTPQEEVAIDLCKSCLLSAENYNFNEVVRHRVLKSIGPESAYAIANGQNIYSSLLVIIASGDYEIFREFSKTNQEKYAGYETIIEQKAKAYALLMTAFNLPQNNRVLTFEDISQTLHLSIDSVEQLVLHAFATKLLTGRIDSVLRNVTLFTLAPRALDVNMLRMMVLQLQALSCRIGPIEKQLEQFNAPLLNN